VAPLIVALVVAYVDSVWGVVAGIGCGLLLFGCAQVRPTRPIAQTVATLAVVGALGVVGVHAVHRHVLMLLLMVASTLMLGSLWRKVPQGDRIRIEREPHPLEGTSVASICLVAFVALESRAASAAGVAAIGAFIASIPWMRVLRRQWNNWLAWCAVTILLVAMGMSAWVAITRVSGAYLMISAVLSGMSALLSMVRLRAGRGILALVLEHPARLLVGTFAGLCAVGTVMLALPWSSPRTEGVGILDAAFSSVSASCVTGLTVLDPSTDLSVFGQLSLLLLIQAGGLGIMTISSSALSLLGRRLSLRQEAVMASLVSRENRADVYHALRRTLSVTLVFETVGAWILAFSFVRLGTPWPKALWHGVFTSISAFCNAGFALQPDNLIHYQRSPIVLDTVSLLIIAGGLSPVVIVALPHALRGRRLGLQAKVAIVSTVFLLVLGSISYGALEWERTLAGLTTWDRIHNAWFQSVTLRTAGFCSVDYQGLHPATWVMMMVLMFVGGCPGGTAGGIKTTTAFVLLVALLGALRGKASAEVFGRTIPAPTVFKATAIATLSGMATMIAVSLLLIAQPLAIPVALFEVVSALGTVGLSLGGTAQLDETGKILIMGCMFLGRVGPLTAFLILSDRRAASSWELPAEEIEVG
jgi:trk system potassium uptake protein TrkH